MAEPKKIPGAEMLKEHRAMMAGVSEPSKSDADYKARQAYRRAYEDHVSKFLNGDLKDGQGNVVQHREDALTMAHAEGLKAQQSIKKSGLKFSVHTDGY